MRHCAVCDGLHAKGTRCNVARSQTQRSQDARRGSSTERGYDTAWRALVQQVLARDGHTCQLQLHCCTGVATTGDHVVPLSRGGARLDSNNVVAACRACNSSKRDR